MLQTRYSLTKKGLPLSFPFIQCIKTYNNNNNNNNNKYNYHSRSSNLSCLPFTPRRTYYTAQKKIPPWTPINAPPPPKEPKGVFGFSSNPYENTFNVSDLEGDGLPEEEDYDPTEHFFSEEDRNVMRYREKDDVSDEEEEVQRVGQESFGEIDEDSTNMSSDFRDFQRIKNMKLKEGIKNSGIGEGEFLGESRKEHAASDNNEMNAESVREALSTYFNQEMYEQVEETFDLLNKILPISRSKGNKYGGMTFRSIRKIEEKIQELRDREDSPEKQALLKELETIDFQPLFDRPEIDNEKIEQSQIEKDEVAHPDFFNNIFEEEETPIKPSAAHLKMLKNKAKSLPNITEGDSVETVFKKILNYSRTHKDQYNPVSGDSYDKTEMERIGYDLGSERDDNMIVADRPEDDSQIFGPYPEFYKIVNDNYQIEKGLRDDMIELQELDSEFRKSVYGDDKIKPHENPIYKPRLVLEDFKVNQVIEAGVHTKITNQGRINSFSCLVVIGTGTGLGSYGYGKGETALRATERAYIDAHKKLVSVTLYKGTLLHDVVCKNRSSIVKFVARGPYGLGAVHPKIDLFPTSFGMRNVTVRTHGRRTWKNMLEGVYRDLPIKHRHPEQIARNLGKKFVDLTRLQGPRLSWRNKIPQIRRSPAYKPNPGVLSYAKY